MLSGILTEIYKDIRGSIEKKREESEAEKAQIENAAHQYEKEYRERHGQIKVFCVGMREPIQLDDVYVPAQVSSDRSRSSYRSSEEVERAFRQRNRSISSLDERKDGIVVANEKQYLMLLGAPGVGKSTFLRKVGLEALKENNSKFEHKCIPVFLELKRFTADEINIETLITEELRTCGFPDPEQVTEKALKSGKLLILFDGLDEVPVANVDKVVSKIEGFVNQYKQNRFIASCQVAAYKGGFTLFTDVEMAAFDDTQIEAYIKKWFDSTPGDYRQQLDAEMETSQKCWNTLNAIEHQATKELARNPLLLTLLCMVYDNSQNFPRNRASLYEKALNIFLEEWPTERRIRREESISRYLDIADEKWMLSEIAAKNFEKNLFFFSQAELIAQIREFGAGNANTPETFNAPKILETILIDQGLFVERVRGSYSFSHLTFQEYLTANYIVDNPRSIQGLVNQYLHDPQWREIFLLTAGLMYEADNLLLAMEAKVAKLINTDRFKRLAQWSERITNITDSPINGVTKRKFAIHQYLSLQLLNIVHEGLKHNVSEDEDFYQYLNLNQELDLYLDLDLYLNLYQDLYQYRYLNQELDLYLDQYQNFDLDLDLDLDLYQDLDLNLYQDLYQYQDLYLNQDLNQDLSLNLYQDFYRYMDADFYFTVSSEFGDRFDKELEERITFVTRMEEAKIFKGVDLQRIVRRFKRQQEFIIAAREGKYVKSPKESIHDTWLSVLQITDDMLAISHEELENYQRYLRVVELIVACKEAAGRVSPSVWDRIEKRFLTSEAVEIKVHRTNFVTKIAVNPDTGRYYLIDLPAPEVVREAILELEYPSDGLRVVTATERLAEKFQLSDEQERVKNRSDLNVFRYDVVAPQFKRLLQEGKLEQPNGPRTPYLLAESDSDLPVADIRETPDKPELPSEKKTAVNPDTREEYQIALPATDVVKEALLNFDYPPIGIHIRDIAEALADQFALTEEQSEAKGKYGLVWKLHVNVAAIDLLNSEQLLRIRRGWIINPEQYSKLSPSGTESSDHRYDVFISHATEDKDEIVRPLADALIARNVRVWYDESELRMGDSVRGKIEEGLANSRYGIVVLSHAFFQKKWPKYELNALVAREMADKPVILPIWHKITENEIMSHSPGLTDKIALNTSDFTINEIAQEIAEVIQNSRGPLSKITD